MYKVLVWNAQQKRVDEQRKERKFSGNIPKVQSKKYKREKGIKVL